MHVPSLTLHSQRDRKRAHTVRMNWLAFTLEFYAGSEERDN